MLSRSIVLDPLFLERINEWIVSQLKASFSQSLAVEKLT